MLAGACGADTAGRRERPLWAVAPESSPDLADSGGEGPSVASAPSESDDRVAGEAAGGAGIGGGAEGEGQTDGHNIADGGEGDTGGAGAEGDGATAGGGGAGAGGGGAGAGGEGAGARGADGDAAPAGTLAPLTGLATADPSLAQRRALAVKIDNGRSAQPQVGLAAADVVYEVLVEGGETRFIAVFHSEVPDRIGPVRSARSTDLDILADLATPYLAASGANRGVLRELRGAHRSGTLIDVSGLRLSTVYSRDPDRALASSMFLNPADLGDGTPASVAPLFEYGSSNPPGIDGAAGVRVSFHESSGRTAYYVWDAGLRGWARIIAGRLHTVATDLATAAVAPANVAILQMSYRVSGADAASPQAVSFDSGDALVLTAGEVHEAAWERVAGRAGFRFTDAAGDTIRLSPGPTWVLLANRSRRFPVTRTTLIDAAAGAGLLGWARAFAAPPANGASVS